MHLSHHVLDSWLEVAEEGFGLVSLHLAVLDGLSSQEVVHLDSEDGRRAALVLAAGITWPGGRRGIFPTWSIQTGSSTWFNSTFGQADDIGPSFRGLSFLFALRLIKHLNHLNKNAIK